MSRKTNRKMCLMIVLSFLISMVGNAKADFIFGEPINLGPPVNTSATDVVGSISADGLSLYFSDGPWVLAPGGYGGGDLWVSKRASKDEPWGEPINLGSVVNSTDNDATPSVSADGLLLFFLSNRPGGHGGEDIYVSKRETINSEWGTPVNLGPAVNSSAAEVAPNISADGCTLYFGSNRAGGSGQEDIWVSTRINRDAPWSLAENMGPIINSSTGERRPCISADGLTLFWHSNRSGGFGIYDLWMAKRPSVFDTWDSPMNLGPTVNTSFIDVGPVMSADGQTLYFTSDRPGGYGDWDIYQVSIDPVVDLNDDGIVDVKDIVFMTQHWGENNPLCDIGPTPFGDGIVDVRDLLALTEYIEPIEQQLKARAHWTLDETEGIVAYDSAGNNDAITSGDPLWQPSDGIIGGALLLDGIDDYIETPFILNPASGSLSVSAWIKGGASGQAIISQTGDFGGTWLGINNSEGLMTGFNDVYFGALESEAVITDVQWHHVCLVYNLDVFHRLLYVDGILVAEDSAVVAGSPSDGGMNIGASKDLDAGSFFSGLIDDVRIYNAALTTEEITELAR